ncbi:N-lysine methyltransferase KMT5A-A [Danio aesculapii]|uniref:N-lysine methyltransferase KMT5A-A n=1 Tax=Danio aesculapii TaxID=1142201 RepID=UPI0024BF59EA|nr:N-lysine methyltransferase KMT5A-A [Danio aesculapii]
MFPAVNEIKVQTWRREERGECPRRSAHCRLFYCAHRECAPAARSLENRGPENRKARPEATMSGDVLCNGHSAFHRLLKHSSSRTHEALAVKIIQENKTTRLFCTAPEPRRDGGVNGEFLLNSAELQDEQTLPLHCIHSTADITSSKHRKPARRKVKRSTKRAGESKSPPNRKVTDYFPIRRSSRKSKSELKYEEKQHIDTLISNGIEDGMMVRFIEGKGRGVFATQPFQKGQYVVEYHGDLLQITDAKQREALYAQDPSTGCYMYYFQYLSKTYCVDATKESDRLGRLINHSKNGNCQTKLHAIAGKPHLILVASRDIQEGEELLYDYGDRSKSSIEAHPWLKH